MQGPTNWTAWFLIAPIADLQVEHQGRFHTRPSLFILTSIVKQNTCFIHISATWHRHMLHIFSITWSCNIVVLLKDRDCMHYILPSSCFFFVFLNIVAKQHITEMYKQWINKYKTLFFLIAECLIVMGALKISCTYFHVSLTRTECE